MEILNLLSFIIHRSSYFLFIESDISDFEDMIGDILIVNVGLLDFFNIIDYANGNGQYDQFIQGFQQGLSSDHE